MIRDLTENYAVLQTGYWRVEIDLSRPRFVSLRCATDGLGGYCQEMLEPGFGAESIAETKQGIIRSRDSIGHGVVRDEWRSLTIQKIRLGDFALVDWKIMLTGDKGEILLVEITREIIRSVELVTDVVFGFQCLREFSFWSRPSLRFNHDPAAGYQTTHSSREEMATRRVIGYHGAHELPEFVVHATPSYPDYVLKLDKGYYHLEQHYARHVTFGLSSSDFSSGPKCLLPGREQWTLELSAMEQGKMAPVTFRSSDDLTNSFVPSFFDGYLLSGVACDHELVGNNPYRHVFAPGCFHFYTRGYLTTDRRHWSETQGDIEARFERQIRRTLSEGRVTKDRVVIMIDSGVWTDACGGATHEYGSPSLDAYFVVGCCYHLLKTGNRQFVCEIYDDLYASLIKLKKLDVDHDGLLENPIPGIPGSPASTYNDCLSIGHKDGYLNAVAHEAFSLFASLSDFIGRHDDANELRQLAVNIAKAYNEQLWDEKAGCYLGWIDVAGGKHNEWYTFINFPAIAAGIASEERARRIMKSFKAHPNHHRIFAAGVNLDPVAGAYSHVKNFGIWLNGGVLLGPAAFELAARAIGLGGEGAWEMMSDLMAQWQKDRLCGTPLFDWVRPLPHLFSERIRYTGKNAYTWIDGKEATGAGTEPYLADGGAILWGLYAGVFGLWPDFQGLTLRPHVPKALADTEIKIRLMGKQLEIKYHGFGDLLERTTVNGRKIDGNRLGWEDIADQSTINIQVKKEL